MKTFKKLFTFMLISLLCIGLFKYSPTVLAKDPPSDIYLVSDSNSKKPLPSAFRIDTSLNISGSSQFTPTQLSVIKNQINKNNIVIVDLRQESHGFINNNAVAFYNKNKYINNGMDSKQVLESEKTMLSTIPLNKESTIYHRNGTPNYNLLANKVTSESEISSLNGLGYVRVPVTDTYIPSPQIVDQFVEFTKSLKPDTHLHFHCLAGQGRTTTFMSMYQMLKDTNKLSLDNILTHQTRIGGVELMTSPVRNAFIKDFYKYVQENKSSNYSTPYSKWTKSPFTLATNQPPQ